MVENRENLGSSEIPISLFENAYNALKAKYETAKTPLSQLFSYDLPHEERIEIAHEFWSDEFLFVGEISTLVGGTSVYLQDNIISLAMFRRDEFTMHAFTTRTGESLKDAHHYLVLTKTEETYGTGTGRPDYEFSALEVFLDVRSILNPRKEMSERRKTGIVRRMNLTEQDKEDILKSLIKDVPSWTRVKISPVK